jgi:erythromycin esterase-like protein
MAQPLSSIGAALAQAAIRLDGGPADYDALLHLVGDARFVLLGEATHGSHEFYEERARITQRLVLEKGFTAVAVEADWPDAWRVNRYVRGRGTDRDARSALSGFQRFPSWMWRNTDVLRFVEWLHGHNATAAPAQRAGFYGLDLYSLFTSIDEVLRYLDQVDPAAAAQARRRYDCFDQYGDDCERYAEAAGFGLSPSCESGVLAQLMALQDRAGEYLRRSTGDESDDPAAAFFHARQNARLVVDAEAYYRTMFHGRISSWNLRDQHMADTLDALADFLTARQGQPAKVVVWAHNSHIGDARAEVSAHGEWNLGQLARERHGGAVRLVGFSTYEGWVTAASNWGGPAERKRVRQGLPGSIEAALHDTGIDRFMLATGAPGPAAAALAENRPTRAIGVVYRPHTERQSHYFGSVAARQFDALLHFDDTAAVEPLELATGLGPGDLPETFPEGI